MNQTDERQVQLQPQPVHYVDDVPVVPRPKKIEGHKLGRKTVGADKLTGSSIQTGDINDSAMFAAGVVNAAAIGALGVVSGKIKFSAVTVSISAGQSSGSSGADGTLTGGQIFGFYPNAVNNPDQHIKSIVLNANGSLTITLSGNSTNAVAYVVVVVKSS